MTEDHAQPLETFEPDTDLKIDDYKPFLGQKGIDDIKALAEPIEGKGWANLNSTFMGGGVAEMLCSVIPVARSLGVNAQWQTIRGHDQFFQVTKKFHNMLQGVGNEISAEEMFEAYLGNIKENAKNTNITSDMIVVHDPQPAALIASGVFHGNVLWRCHIDTSHPNPTVWKFFVPYINLYAGAIFTMPQFVGQDVHVPTYQIMPCIDPLAPKNHQFDAKEAIKVLTPLFNEHNIEPDRPIVAAISRYDIHKNQKTILKAFKKMVETKKFEKPPYLIFLGNTATDDPEGGAMLEDLKNECGDHGDIKFWVNVENNDQVVGALMHIAKVFTHISTKEGFGLVVSEALWQGTPVIGSNIGGIPMQVIDHKNGYIVNPLDEAAVAEKMSVVLEDEALAEKMGQAARDHVRNNFLIPSLIKKYFMLLRYLTEIDQVVPEFRMNELTYTEKIIQARRKHPSFAK